MNSVKIITSKAFSQEELIASLLQIGVKREEMSDPIWDFVVRAGEATVWVIPDSIEENYPNPEVDAVIERKLDGPPQTYVVLYISRAAGSEQLALELAIRFAQRWPSVLDNLSGRARRIFTLAELQNLQEKGLGFREDAKGVPLVKGIDTPGEEDGEYIAPWRQKEIEKQASEATEQNDPPQTAPDNQPDPPYTGFVNEG